MVKNTRSTLCSYGDNHSDKHPNGNCRRRTLLLRTKVNFNLDPNNAMVMFVKLYLFANRRLGNARVCAIDTISVSHEIKIKIELAVELLQPVGSSHDGGSDSVKLASAFINKKFISVNAYTNVLYICCKICQSKEAIYC